MAILIISSLTLSVAATFSGFTAEPTATGITFSNWVLNAIRIPNSTSMLSEGLVNNGIITYQATIGVKVKNNGSNYANKSISWSTTATSSNAVIVSKDSKTDSYGNAYVTFHVRGIEQVPVKITCGGKSSTVSVDLGTKATYLSNFKITQYITAKEADSYYTGNKITVNGLNGTYKSDFIEDVKMQGSGLAENGKYVKYYNGKFSHQTPTTALGYAPTAGTTIATDPYYIPCVKKSDQIYSGYVTILGIGKRIAQDRGGLITGFHIDVYKGVGRANVEYNYDGYYSVLFNGVNTWGRNANNAGLNATGIDDATSLRTNVPQNMLCTSADNQHTAYVSSIDYSKANAITISVFSNNAFSTQDAKDSALSFSLARPVLSVDELKLTDHSVVAIGQINPSLQIYQEFDLQTGDILQEYYGYGFAETPEGVFYIQAPQHFSGVSGRCRILNASGDVLYESDDDVLIRGSLVYKNGTLVFTEYNINSSEYIERTVSTSNRFSLSTGYYYE